MTQAQPSSAPSSMRRDIVSAYAASVAKIGSWVVVLGLVYRYIGPAEFALLALVRGTIGILNYTSLGLSPAMIRLLAETTQAKAQATAEILSYETPDRDLQVIYSNGLLIALICGAIGLLVSLAYATYFNRFFKVPSQLLEEAPFIVGAMGVGTVLRLMSDAPGSLIQSRRLIARDNYLIITAEVLWVLLCLVQFSRQGTRSSFLIALAYSMSGAALFIFRDLAASKLTGLGLPSWKLIDGVTLKRLLAFGSLVLFAQLADYLYAPCDYILINLFLGWESVATYTPAMTIDSGLLLLVGGLSSVILPRAALAHSAGEIERVRRYYIYGTLGSAFLLLFAGVIIWIASPLIFRLWLADPMLATQTILPLVLIHTIIGGSSAVGRSILLGMGKVRPFTMSVLLAGVGNVVLSYIFVRQLHLGLKGIVYGTIVVVVLRCGVWMPWYVLRATK